MSNKRALQDTRAIAALQLADVIGKGHSFDSSALPELPLETRDLGFVRELCFGTLRHYFLLKALVDPLLKKPLAKKDSDIYALLLSGLYQLRFMQTPEHAALNASVNAAKLLNTQWAAGLVNGVSRNLLRKGANDPANDDALTAPAKASHPEWLFKELQKQWPGQIEQIIAYNNSTPPMTLRVNTHLQERADYISMLEAEGIAATANPLSDTAVTLQHGVSVQQLPGFDKGKVSVQDAGAQWAATLLELQPRQNVLDACAAPGGKSIHALQLEPDIRLTALDNQASRLQKLANDLQRCGLKATLAGADAANADSWWQGEPFDRILLDAPCTGSGIISHHPDIKLLRQYNDIAGFAAQQQRLLNALWPLLKTGGQLLYCTCSILP